MAGLPAEALAEPAIKYGRSQCRFCGTGCTVLPGVKDGRVVSIKGDADRRSQFIPKLVDPPGEAMSDFRQIREIARRISQETGQKDHVQGNRPPDGQDQRN